MTVLARLAREGAGARDGQRLTRQHIALVARTYLGGEKLYTVAADLNLSPANASKHRARAEALIALRLGRPDLVRRRPT